MTLNIRPMEAIDWRRVREIYQQGLSTGLASFDTSIPLWRDWDAGHLPIGRLVAEDDSGIVGWVALTPAAST